MTKKKRLLLRLKDEDDKNEIFIKLWAYDTKGRIIGHHADMVMDKLSCIKHIQDNYEGDLVRKMEFNGEKITLEISIVTSVRLVDILYI